MSSLIECFEAEKANFGSFKTVLPWLYTILLFLFYKPVVKPTISCPKKRNLTIAEWRQQQLEAEHREEETEDTIVREYLSELFDGNQELVQHCFDFILVEEELGKLYLERLFPEEDLGRLYLERLFPDKDDLGKLYLERIFPEEDLGKLYLERLYPEDVENDVSFNCAFVEWPVLQEKQLKKQGLPSSVRGLRTYAEVLKNEKPRKFSFVVRSTVQVH